MGNGLYVYGIIQNKYNQIQANMMGIDNIHHIISVAVEDAFIITSLVDLDEYGEGQIDQKLEDMVWVEEKAMKHFTIIQQLSKEQPVMPMKFCTIFLNEENLRVFYRKYANRIKEAFTYFKDKEEWTLKVFCDRKRFLEVSMDEERSALERQVANVSRGTAYFMKKKLAVSLEEEARDKINKIKDGLWKELSEKVDKIKLNKNLSCRVIERKEEMILNTALLIPREMVSGLHNWLTEKEDMLKTLNIYVELAGPWPFYNFTNLFIF